MTRVYKFSSLAAVCALGVASVSAAMAATPTTLVDTVNTQFAIPMSGHQGAKPTCLMHNSSMTGAAYVACGTGTTVFAKSSGNGYSITIPAAWQSNVAVDFRLSYSDLPAGTYCNLGWNGRSGANPGFESYGSTSPSTLVCGNAGSSRMTLPTGSTYKISYGSSAAK